MIWKAVPDETLLAEARQMAETLANGPTVGLGLTKMAVQAASENTLDAQLELEAGFQKICSETRDYAEGFLRFLKSAPLCSTERKHDT